MKVTISEIVNANEALKTTEGKELPFKLAYWFSRLQKKLASPIETFNKTRNDLFKKYGETQEDNISKIKAENTEAFLKEINAIVVLEEEIDFNPISLSLFEGSFSKEFFIAMDKFITE